MSVASITNVETTMHMQFDLAAIRFIERMAIQQRFDYAARDGTGVWFWQKSPDGDRCVGGVAIPKRPSTASFGVASPAQEQA
jgi:hypothetical protein